MEDNMLDFVARVFRGWMNVLLWLILIGCAVGCFILGGIFLGGWRFSFGYAVLGLLVGSLFGLIVVILSGGLIANFLNMADDISTIKNHLSKTGNTSGGSSPVLNSNNTQNVPPINRNTGGPWVCKKCHETNTENTSLCKWCGEYK
jgi:hypothetical protein